MSDVVLCVGSQEFRASRKVLSKRSSYLAQVFGQATNYSEVRITLPTWVAAQSVQAYLQFIDSATLPASDLLGLQKLLWLSDFLQDALLTQSLVTEAIVPNLTPDTALLFLQDACNKQNSGPLDSSWQILFDRALGCVSQHSSYIRANQTDSLLSLAPPVLQKFIEASLQFEFGSSGNSQLLRDYLQNKGFVSIVQTLTTKPEAPRSLRCEWQLDTQESGNFYKESEVFSIDKTNWKLSVWSFAHDGQLEISLKNVLSSLPKDTVVCIDCVLSVNGEESRHELIFSSHTESQQLMKKVPHLSHSASFQLKAQVDYVKSYALGEITKNPRQYELAGLPFSMLHFVLSYKYLNVSNEDQAFDMLADWAEHNRIDANSLHTLLECIRWDFLSLRCLVHSASKARSLHSAPSYASLFREALGSKTKVKKASLLRSSSLLNERPVDVGPRKSYKHTLKPEEFPTLVAYSNALLDLLLEQEEESPELLKLQSKKATLEAQLAEQKTLRIGNQSIEENDSFHSRADMSFSSEAGWSKTLQTVKKQSHSRRLCDDLLGKIRRPSRGHSPNSSAYSNKS